MTSIFEVHGILSVITIYEAVVHDIYSYNYDNSNSCKNIY